MVAHPIEIHLRSAISLRSTCFVRMLRNSFEMRVFANFFIVLPADVIRSEKKKKMRIIIAMSSIKKELL